MALFIRAILAFLGALVVLAVAVVLALGWLLLTIYQGVAALCTRRYP